MEIYQATVYKTEGLRKTEVPYLRTGDRFQVSEVACDGSLRLITWTSNEIRSDGTIAGLQGYTMSINWRRGDTPPTSFCQRCPTPQYDGRSHRKYCPPGTDCYKARMAENQAKRRHSTGDA